MEQRRNYPALCSCRTISVGICAPKVFAFTASNFIKIQQHAFKLLYITNKQLDCVLDLLGELKANGLLQSLQITKKLRQHLIRIKRKWSSSDMLTVKFPIRTC